MKLTPKQAIFVAEYLIDFNGTRAALAAGYSPKSAKHSANANMERPEIQAAIQAQMDLRQKRTLITADKVLTDIEAIKQDAMSIEYDEEKDGDGNVVARKSKGMRNHTAALKAAELQGKHLVLFSDKVQHTGPDGGPVQVQMSDEQVKARIAELEAKMGKTTKG